MVTNEGNTTKAKVPMGKQINLFKKHVVRLKQCAMAEPDAQFFQRWTGKSRPLKRLGVACSLPALSSRIALSLRR